MSEKNSGNPFVAIAGLVLLVVMAVACFMETTLGGKVGEVSPGIEKVGELLAGEANGAAKNAAAGLQIPVSGTPTPDAPHPLPTVRLDQQDYTVQPGDTLNKISQRFGVDMRSIMTANNLDNPDLLEVGQYLLIPASQPGSQGPSFKVIPDSELVYGPASASFDAAAFIQEKGGFLSQYGEDVDGAWLSGAQIIQRVSQEYSVNPRLLLAVLEFQSGWVTSTAPAEESLTYPLGYADPWRKGLYFQMAFAANNLNRGYYLWRVNAVSSWVLADGAVAPASPIINNGTAGVQALMALLYGGSSWQDAINESGLYQTYAFLFGNPFAYAVEPILPPTLMQAPMQLPFEEGQSWSFTGGPHGGWADGSAWAAIDFAPPGEALGCVTSESWVTAVADGPIVRSENGAVVQDLDGDGYEQTGWTVLYMHVESRDRVPVGAVLKTGERIGHPSCEGGVSTGTHLHLARRYNGEWIPADGPLPFNLDNWISSGSGTEYDGTLTKNGTMVEAWVGRRPENQIQR